MRLFRVRFTVTRMIAAPTVVAVLAAYVHHRGRHLEVTAPPSILKAGPKTSMDWNHPFDPVVITVDEVVTGERDVVLVMQDGGHGGWQFYDGQAVAGRAPAVMPKADILALDPSLSEVTDLPVGWLARRTARGQEWAREPFPAQAPDG